MPIPLIPALIAAASALLGGKGVYDTVDASKRIKAVNDMYNLRRSDYEKAVKHYHSEQHEAEKAFEQLAEIRLNALVALGKAVNFLKKAKIKDRKLSESFEISPQKLKTWETASINAIEILGGLTSAGLSGASTAAAAYGLVGLLGTASTGTAIASLSGAAATNATLAWLGGGAIAAGGGGVAAGTFVLAGVVAGPAILVTGFFAQGKAEEIETQVIRNIAEMEVAESKMSQQLGILKIILTRVDELKISTIEVTTKLEQLLTNLNAIPSNIFVRYKNFVWSFILKLFTGRDLYMEEAYQVARVAKCLGDLLDVAILDNQGNLNQ